MYRGNVTPTTSPLFFRPVRTSRIGIPTALHNLVIFLTEKPLPVTTDTMSDLKTAQDMMAAAVAAKTADDPEIMSVKRVIKLLDKTSKSNRTYGSANPVATKFSQQLFEELSTHLATHTPLKLLIQRSQLLCGETVVYQAETDGGSENLAFKLYADGIREVVLHQGLSQEDMAYFLDSLWAGADPAVDDDDIVTRIWSKNMPALTIVTAEEIAKASTGTTDGFLRLDGGMNSSDSTLRELLDREREKKESRQAGPTGGEGTAEGRPRNRFQSGLAGYDISEEELAKLAVEIEAESKQDGILYILDMLTAILASEKSPTLLTKLFGLWRNVTDALIQQGRWSMLESVLSLLYETDAVRPDLADEHKLQLANLFHSLGQPEHIKHIEHYLNRAADANTEGLPTILLMMKEEGVPALCALLGNLESPAHQAIVSDAIGELAQDKPEPVLRGLADRRPGYVRNLLAILMKWNRPQFAENVEKLIRHPDVHVRKEVIRAIGLFRPSGNGSKLIGFMADADESVRHVALRMLAAGRYTAPFSLWSTYIHAEDFFERPLSEKRAIYQAIRATSGDEAVPYWENLLTERTWTNRKKKEELALLAADALGKLGTPVAVAALELGIKKGGASIRQACTAALAHAQKQRKTPPTAA